jgi:hypothetical protein
MKNPHLFSRPGSTLSQVRIAIAGTLLILGAAMAVLGAGKGGGGGGTSGGGSSGTDYRTDGPKANRATVDNTSVIVQLKGDPLSTDVKTKPPPRQENRFQ